jgi:hypothetical protein
MAAPSTTGLLRLRLAPSRATVQRAKKTVVRAAAQEESSAWRPGMSKRMAHPKRVALPQRERPDLMQPTSVDWVMDDELSTRVKNPKRRAGTQDE